mgnify:CR=1 FL=1
MAQVLKEAQRSRILSAARQELLQYGYRDASMRRIAQQAQMTVGNLYRYFKNKDELIRVITEPALQRLDALVRELTDDRVTLRQVNAQVGMTCQDLQDRMAVLAGQIVDLYFEMPQEMRILMLHSSISDQIALWFSHLLEVLWREWDNLFLPQRQTQTLCRMLSAALRQGMREMFTWDSLPLDRGQLTAVLQAYFDLFVTMLGRFEKGAER